MAQLFSLLIAQSGRGGTLSCQFSLQSFKEVNCKSQELPDTGKEDSHLLVIEAPIAFIC